MVPTAELACSTFLTGNGNSSFTTSCLLPEFMAGPMPDVPVVPCLSIRLVTRRTSMPETPILFWCRTRRFFQIHAYEKRMGWTLPWFSSYGSDFNRDFGVTSSEGEGFGLSIFLRDEKNVYRTYFIAGRGVDALGSVWSFLDLTPFGRQETWETSTAGWPQTEPDT